VTNEDRRDEGLEPRHPLPGASSHGPAYDAAVERSQAAFADIRQVLAGKPVLETVGDLAALLALLPADLPLWLDDQVRTDRDNPASGGDVAHVVVAEVIALASPPSALLSHGDGQDFHELVPALQLGTRVLPSSSVAAAAPEHTRPYYLHDRAEAALEDGEIGAYLTLAAKQLTGIASNLDSEVIRWLGSDSATSDRVTSELTTNAGTLRAVGSTLTTLAPLAEAVINDEDVDEDPDGGEDTALDDAEAVVEDAARTVATEEILRTLPQTLDNIIAAHREENPNPAKGLYVLIDGGPLDGRTELNDGTFWHGDGWYPEVDGVEHHYRLGTRSSGHDRTWLWFYQGLRHGDQ
jgi:hypothetical protein